MSFSDRKLYFSGLVALREIDLSYNDLRTLQNRTHGLFEDVLSIRKVILKILTNTTFNRKNEVNHLGGGGICQKVTLLYKPSVCSKIGEGFLKVNQSFEIS